jgi:hypothetical protein
MARTTPTRYEFDPDNSTSGIAGASFVITAALTNSSTTTAEINKQGYSHGTVQNVTGSAVTVTYWAAMPTAANAGTAGTAYALYDQDGVAVTQTLATSGIEELPSSVAGVAFLVPVSDAASDSLVFYFTR